MICAIASLNRKFLINNSFNNDGSFNNSGAQNSFNSNTNTGNNTYTYGSLQGSYNGDSHNTNNGG